MKHDAEEYAERYYDECLAPAERGGGILPHGLGRYQNMCACVRDADCLVVDECSQVDSWVVTFLRAVVQLGRTRAAAGDRFAAGDSYRGLRVFWIGNLSQLPVAAQGAGKHDAAAASSAHTPRRSDLFVSSPAVACLPLHALTACGRTAGSADAQLLARAWEQARWGHLGDALQALVQRGHDNYETLTNEEGAVADARRAEHETYPRTYEDLFAPDGRAWLHLHTANRSLQESADRRVKASPRVHETNAAGETVVGGPTIDAAAVDPRDGAAPSAEVLQAFKQRIWFAGTLKPGYLYLTNDTMRYLGRELVARSGGVEPLPSTREWIRLVKTEVFDAATGAAAPWPQATPFRAARHPTLAWRAVFVFVRRAKQPELAISSLDLAVARVEMKQQDDEGLEAEDAFLLAPPVLPAGDLTIMQAEGIEAPRVHGVLPGRLFYSQLFVLLSRHKGDLGTITLFGWMHDPSTFEHKAIDWEHVARECNRVHPLAVVDAHERGYLPGAAVLGDESVAPRLLAAALVALGEARHADGLRAPRLYAASHTAAAVGAAEAASASLHAALTATRKRRREAAAAVATAATPWGLNGRAQLVVDFATASGRRAEGSEGASSGGGSSAGGSSAATAAGTSEGGSSASSAAVATPPRRTRPSGNEPTTAQTTVRASAILEPIDVDAESAADDDWCEGAADAAIAAARSLVGKHARAVAETAPTTAQAEAAHWVGGALAWPALAEGGRAVRTLAQRGVGGCDLKAATAIVLATLDDLVQADADAGPTEVAAVSRVRSRVMRGW